MNGINLKYVFRAVDTAVYFLCPCLRRGVWFVFPAPFAVWDGKPVGCVFWGVFLCYIADSHDMNLKALQYIMGHANITMILNYFMPMQPAIPQRWKRRLHGRIESFTTAVLLLVKHQYPDTYELHRSVSSFNSFGTSISMTSSENWQVPTFLCPPPPYFNIRLPTSMVQLRLMML